MVLLVDPVRWMRERLAEHLRLYGCSVREAGSLEEAFADMDRIRPDVILTELVLPDGQGSEAVRQLRRRAPQVPVVACTVLAHREEVLAACRAGVADFLMKPIIPQRLRHCLERLQHSQGVGKRPCRERC